MTVLLSSDHHGIMWKFTSQLSSAATKDDVSLLQQKVKDMEALKLAAAQDSMGSAGAGTENLKQALPV